MMNFETLAKKFLQLSTLKKISSNAQCLYFQLLNFFQCHFWQKEPLEVDNMQIHYVTNLSRQQISNARNELEQLGLIKYIKASGSRAGKYELIDISSANLKSIIAVSNLSEAKIDNLAVLSKQVDDLNGEYRFWGEYILQVLTKSTQQASDGVYNNFYATTQVFLKAQQTVQIETIYKLIEIMKNKPDLINRDAYILTVIANTVKDKLHASA